jgi:hypothetical protein
MPPTTPPLNFEHLPGQEIETKHKEAIRQLYGFAKIPVELLMTRYELPRSTIEKILRYDAPERTRISNWKTLPPYRYPSRRDYRIRV